MQLNLHFNSELTIFHFKDVSRSKMQKLAGFIHSSQELVHWSKIFYERVF